MRVTRASTTFAPTWLLATALLGACGTTDDNLGAMPCGPNGTCPAGYTCEPKTNLCELSGGNKVDAAVTDAGADASGAPDGRGSVDAKPPASDASTPDAARPDASTPDAPSRPAALSLDPTSQDFGMATLGSTGSPLTWTVLNGGDLPSGLIAATVSDTESFAVTGGTCIGAALAAGAQCTVLVAFNPSGTAGPKAATLTVTGSPGGAPTASLTGAALTPGALQLTPSAHGFGSHAIGTGGAETLFTLTNTGQSPSGSLTIHASVADFTISSNQCPDTLAGGATCTIGVVFAPRAVGLVQGATLEVSAAPGGDAASGLSGTGTAQIMVTNAGGGTVTSDVPGIDCGNACTGTFSATPVKLTATPDSTHTFGGWSDACSGTDDCRVDLTSATRKATARFDLKPDAHASITSGPDARTRETQATFVFGADAPVLRLECSLDAVPFDTCTSPATFGALLEGDHTFQVRAVNLDGTPEATPAEFDWTIDLTGPTTALVGPAEASTSGRAVTFTWSAEPGATFACSLNTPALADCAGGQTSFTGLTGGSNVFRIQATDALGNPGDLLTRTWTVDATPPTVTINPFPSDQSQQAGTVTYTASEASTFECNLDGAGFAACATSGLPFTNLAGGPHGIDVRATDVNQNLGSSQHYAWTVVGPVTVIVEDRNHNPRAGARVVAHRSDGSVLDEQTADASGHAKVNMLPDGMVTAAFSGGFTFILHTVVGVQPLETIRVGNDVLDNLPDQGTVTVTLPGPATDPCCTNYELMRGTFPYDSHLPFLGSAQTGDATVTVHPHPSEVDSTGHVNILAIGVLATFTQDVSEKYAWSTGLNLPLGGTIATTLTAWAPAVSTAVNVVNLPADDDLVLIEAGVTRNGIGYPVFEFLDQGRFEQDAPPLPTSASLVLGLPPAGFADGTWSQVVWQQSNNLTNDGALRAIIQSGTAQFDATRGLPFITGIGFDRSNATRPIAEWTADGSLAAIDGGVFVAQYGFVSGAEPTGPTNWFINVPPGTTSVQMPVLPADLAANSPRTGSVLDGYVQLVESTALGGYAAYKANHWRYFLFQPARSEKEAPFLPATTFTTRLTQRNYSNL